MGPCTQGDKANAILPILHGRDVFVRMATGSGKTLCMFLPPLVKSEASNCYHSQPFNWPHGGAGISSYTLFLLGFVQKLVTCTVR